MKTVTLTEEQCAYVVNALDMAHREARGLMLGHQREETVARHLDCDEAAAESARELAQLARETMLQYAAARDAVKAALN
ncbi:hypothetical protein ACFWDN_13150 [Micromonospora chalcea]